MKEMRISNFPIFIQKLTSEVAGRCLSKKVFLKLLQYLQKKALALGSFFNKVAGMKAYNFIKKRPQHSYFLENIFLQNF